jgi:hypothetical protein
MAPKRCSPRSTLCIPVYILFMLLAFVNAESSRFQNINIEHVGNGFEYKIHRSQLSTHKKTDLDEEAEQQERISKVNAAVHELVSQISGNTLPTRVFRHAGFFSFFLSQSFVVVLC